MKKSHFKNFLYYLGGANLPLVVSFITLPVFSRFLSPEDYGLVALVQVVKGFITIFLGLQIQSSISRFYFEYKGRELKRFLGTVFMGLIVISLLMLVLIYVILPEIIKISFPNINTDDYVLFKIVLFSSFFTVLTYAPKRLLLASEKAKLTLILGVISFVITLISKVILVVFLGKGALGVVESMLIGSVVGFISHILVTRRYFYLNFSLKYIPMSLRYSIPLIPHNLSGIIIFFSDRIILEKFIAISLIGLYSLSDRIASVIYTLLQNLNKVYVPQFMKIMEEDKQKAIHIINSWSKIVYYYLSVVCVFLSLFSIEIISILFDPRYLDLWIYIPLLSLSYLFTSLYLLTSVCLFYEKKTRLIAIISMVSGVSNIIINITFISFIGIFAAILSTVISHFISFYMSYRFSKKYFDLKLDFEFFTKCFLGISVTFIIAYVFNLEIVNIPNYLNIPLKLMLLAFWIIFGFRNNLYKTNSFKLT